ncbi:MAG: MFS transporter [Chloroflexota bacterium]
MIKNKRFPRIFSGWWIVLTGGFVGLWGFGFQMQGISALFKPISSELGFSRAVTSTAASLGRLEGGFEAPLSGWIADRYGPKWIAFAGVFLVGLGLILMNYINSLWAFLVVWGGLVATGANVGLGIPIQTAIANWFVKKRGAALSIRLVISGLSGVLVLPLIAWLISTQGWRMTCVIGGVVMWAIGLPLVWLFVRQHRPEYYGLLPDGATAEERDTSQMIATGVKYAAEVEEVEFSLRQAMRAPTYWLIIAAHSVHLLVEPVMNIHCIPFLTDLGIDPLKAAGMMAIIGVASLPSRLAFGFIADRMKVGRLRFLLAGAYFLQAVGFVAFLLSKTVPMIYLWFILYGIANGAAIAIMNPLRARYFGRKAFGSIMGTASAFQTPFGVVAPIYVGWVYDTTGSYMTTFNLFVALLVLAAVLMSLAVSPKPPARVTEVQKFL